MEPKVETEVKPKVEPKMEPKVETEVKPKVVPKAKVPESVWDDDDNVASPLCPLNVIEDEGKKDDNVPDDWELEAF